MPRIPIHIPLPEPKLHVTPHPHVDGGDVGTVVRPNYFAAAAARSVTKDNEEKSDSQPAGTGPYLFLGLFILFLVFVVVWIRVNNLNTK